MASNNQNWGKKGAALGIVFLVFALFVILLIWVYMKNQNFLPNT
jgi:hypothetical protein